MAAGALRDVQRSAVAAAGPTDRQQRQQVDRPIRFGPHMALPQTGRDRCGRG